MRIYVISLAEAVDRRLQLRQRFPSSYEDFEIFQAVRLRSCDDLPSVYGVSRFDRSLALPELACSLSHVLVLERFIETDESHCLVLEDDVIGCDESIAALRLAVGELEGKSVLICGGQDGLRARRHQYVYRRRWHGLQVVPRLSFGFFARTCCYMVTREAALEIVRLQRECLRRADLWSVLLRRFERVYFAAMLSHPEDLSDSYIEGSRRMRSGGGLIANLCRDGLAEVLIRQVLKLLVAVLGKTRVLVPAEGLRAERPFSDATQ